MGFKERVEKLEARAPVECLVCRLPEVLVYGEPEPSGACLSCGRSRNVVWVVTEKARSATAGILAGVGTG